MEIVIYKTYESIPSYVLDAVDRIDEELIASYIADPFTFNIAVVKLGDEIIGAGLIRVINEFKMILKQELSHALKAKIIKLLMHNAMELKQCKEVMVSVTLPEDGREHYADLLSKHFKFERDTGIVLRLEK